MSTRTMSQVAVFVIILFTASLKSTAGNTLNVNNRVDSSLDSFSGVLIDFRYNETTGQSNDSFTVSSAPGCPKSVDGVPWLYHGNPAKCYLVGTTGPCSPGHLLFGNKTSHWAHCDCMCSPNINTTKWRNKHDVHVKENPHFLFCSLKDIPEMNESVFDKQKEVCYFLDTQGSCQQGEWLVMDKLSPGNVTCVPQCSADTGPFESTWFYNWQTHKCELKSSILLSMPVSLTVDLGQNACEEGKVYSKLLQKCVPKSKAFILKLK